MENLLSIIVHFSLIAVIGSQGTTDDPLLYCPYKWEPWSGNCLDVSELSGSPNQARTHCQDIGGSLAIVENRKQNRYLLDKLPLGNMTTIPLGCTNDESYVWTCLAKYEEEWFWYNETHNLGFWDWEQGEPDNDPDVSSRLFLNIASNWTDESRNDETKDMVVACLSRTITEEVRCPLSWEPVDNKCVYFNTDFVGRPREVRTFCQGLGGSLVTIDSAMQNTFFTDILTEFGKNFLLLGCTDQQVEGYWRCDGRNDPYMVHWTNETEAGYWNWGADHPADDDPEADCSFLRPNGNWRALTCDNEYSMLLTCEQGPTDVECPAGYEPWGDICMHLSEFTGTASTAKEQCLALDGGSLVVIESEAENLFLQYELIQPINAMAVGCGDAVEEGTWICDGKDPNEMYWKSPTDNSGYWNWNPTEPVDDTSKNCMYLYRKAGNYRSESCDLELDMLLACTVDPNEVLPSTITTFTKTTSAAPTATETTPPTATPPATPTATPTPMTMSKSPTERTTTGAKTTTDSPTERATTTADSPTERATTTADKGDPDPQDGLSSGAVAGIVIACIAAVAAALGIIYVFVYYTGRTSTQKSHDLEL